MWYALGILVVIVAFLAVAGLLAFTVKKPTTQTTPQKKKGSLWKRLRQPSWSGSIIGPLTAFAGFNLLLLVFLPGVALALWGGATKMMVGLAICIPLAAVAVKALGGDKGIIVATILVVLPVLSLIPLFIEGSGSGGSRRQEVVREEHRATEKEARGRQVEEKEKSGQSDRIYFTATHDEWTTVETNMRWAITKARAPMVILPVYFDGQSSDQPVLYEPGKKTSGGDGVVALKFRAPTSEPVKGVVLFKN